MTNRRQFIEHVIKMINNVSTELIFYSHSVTLPSVVHPTYTGDMNAGMHVWFSTYNNTKGHN